MVIAAFHISDKSSFTILLSLAMTLRSSCHPTQWYISDSLSFASHVDQVVILPDTAVYINEVLFQYTESTNPTSNHATYVAARICAKVIDTNLSQQLIPFQIQPFSI